MCLVKTPNASWAVHRMGGSYEKRQGCVMWPASSLSGAQNSNNPRGKLTTGARAEQGMFAWFCFQGLLGRNNRRCFGLSSDFFSICLNSLNSI